jgi:hypothetical protein
MRAIELLNQQVKELEGVITSQQERIQTLEGRLAKESPTSSLPAKRLWLVEHQVEENQCHGCRQLTRAMFPASVWAPAQ